MAVLKDLIVHGSSRFLNKAYFDSINADSVEANKGIFNKLIAKDSTLTNATVVGLLDVSGELHTNAWTNSNIATIDGSFYITPTIESNSGTAAVTATTLSFTGTNYAVTSLYTSGDSGVTTYTSWASGSKVLVTGEILVNGEYIPLGSLIGVLDGAATTSSIKVKNITDNHGNASATLTAIGNISGATYRKLKVSLYQRANGSTMYPLGIYMTALGDNGRTFIDIYGGGNATSTAAGGGMAKPVLRIGNLQGLPAFSLPNNTSVSPTGWGIYTNNGFFSGTIVSTQGKIGNFTLGTAIYSGTNSMNSNATGIYLGTDGIRNYNTADKYVNIQNGVITAKGANINGAITAQSLTIESNATINDTSGLIRNDAVQVGGRNLFGYGSDCQTSLSGMTNQGFEIVTEDGFKCAHASGEMSVDKHLTSKIPFTPEPNEVMVISAWVKIKNIAYGTGTPSAMCEFYVGGETIGGAWRSYNTVAAYLDGVKTSVSGLSKLFTNLIQDTDWHKVDFVLEWQNYTFTGNKFPSIYLRNATGDLYVRHIKYERGNKATDWTPAPEDVASDIEDASKVADNYLKFEPGDNGGLMVGDLNGASDTTIHGIDTRNVLIDNNSVDIRDGQNVLASFGETTILGDKEAQHVEISSNGYDLISADKVSIFNVKPSGSLSTVAVKEIVHRDENDTHTVTLLHTPLGNGYYINGLGHINYTLESGKPQDKDIAFVLQPGTINEKSVSTSRYTYTVVFNPNANTVKISISGVGAVSCSLKYVSYYYASSGTDLGAATFAGAVYMNSMAGAMQMYAGIVGQNVDSNGRAVSTAPTGWLLCDGSAISRTIYPYLYAAIGENYGAGDGSTTFNIPNMLNKFPFGAGFDYPLSGVGSVGGSEHATLVLHKHGAGNLGADSTSISHAHGSGATNQNFLTIDTSVANAQFNISSSGARYTVGLSSSGHFHARSTTGNGGGSHTHTISGNTEIVGDSSHGANMPPFRTVNFIIATGETF